MKLAYASLPPFYESNVSCYCLSVYSLQPTVAILSNVKFYDLSSVLKLSSRIFCKKLIWLALYAYHLTEVMVESFYEVTKLSDLSLISRRLLGHLVQAIYKKI